jgi:hypothetical protein
VPYGNASKALSLGFLFKQIYLGMKKVIDLWKITIIILEVIRWLTRVLDNQTSGLAELKKNEFKVNLMNNSWFS